MTGSDEKEASHLLRDAIGGDQAALDRLLLDEHPRLSARINARIPATLRSVITPDDVLQETYAEAFRLIGSFTPRGENALGGWLWLIAEHRLADMIRAQNAAKRGGGRRVLQARGGPEAESVVDLLEAGAFNEHTPSRSAARHEAVAAIQEKLATLEDDYKRALELRYIRGLPVREIAQQMERTERAVHMLCNRGLKKLRTTMGDSDQYLTRK